MTYLDQRMVVKTGMSFINVHALVWLWNGNCSSLGMEPPISQPRILLPCYKIICGENFYEIFMISCQIIRMIDGRFVASGGLSVW